MESKTYPIAAFASASAGGGSKIVHRDAEAEKITRENSAFSAAKKVTGLSSFSSPISSTSKKRGPQLLLCSIAGATAAAGMTISRWLLVETGEVLLLFANDMCTEGEGSGHANDVLIVDGIDSDFSADYSFQCTSDEQDLPKNVGEAVLAIASSPYLRSAPLVLIFLSSTAFLVGLILTHREFQQCWSWIQSCQEYGEECSQQLVTVMGVSNTDELTVRLKEKHIQWKNSFWEQAQKSVDCMDGLVLDDVLQKWIKMGVEFSMGVWGGFVLYSIPEEIFEGTVDGAKGTRRRLIHAADPSLEQIIFRPGGAWDMLPPNLRDGLSQRRRLAGEMKSEVEVDNGAEGMETTSLGSTEQQPIDDDSSNNDEDSSDTPLASPVPSINVRGSNQDSSHIHYARVIHTDGGDKTSSENINGGPKETIAAALSATINDLFVSNFMGAGRPTIEQERTSCPNAGDKHQKIQTQQQQDEHHNEEQRKPSPPQPKLQLEKYLHRTSIAASFLFLCHLRGSPSTRKAWGSAAKFVASLGLVSTAIGAGVASAVLNSNTPALNTMATNPIVGMFYSKILNELRVPQMCVLSTDTSIRMQWILERLREEIRKNKRLHSVLAFMVLYGMKRLTRKNGLHSRYVQYR